MGRRGKLQQTFTWDTGASIASGQRGTLKTVKDGNNRVTTFDDWKRGIPQAVEYADNTDESAVVNAQGWLTAITDETGATTSYGYDTMGRLAAITYPTGDTPAWNATTIVSVPVSTTEYGIGPGHWRRTESTGNARKIIYYDALWRPLLTREYDTADQTGTKRYAAASFDARDRTVHAAYPVATAPTSSGGTWPLPGTDTTYDALGRVTTIEQDSELGVLTTSIDYLAGFMRRVTDPAGNTTTEQFVAWETPGYELPVQVDAPEDVRTTIARDVYGKPTAITRGAAP